MVHVPQKQSDRAWDIIRIDRLGAKWWKVKDCVTEETYEGTQEYVLEQLKQDMNTMKVGQTLEGLFKGGS